MVKTHAPTVDRVARAGLHFVNLVRANEKTRDNLIEDFDSTLYPTEREAWRELCEAVDILRSHLAQ